MLGPEHQDDAYGMRSPLSLNGTNQGVYIAIDEDIDAHCAHARQAGAEIMMEPETQFYGARCYRARDPEGHIWNFGGTMQKKTAEEWDKAGGFTTSARLD